jgi:2-oxoglutarate dehydrogenase complex dehydrogenase (E1) component-like enzyme
VTAYRQHGHKKANINPIAITNQRFVTFFLESKIIPPETHFIFTQ